MKRIGFIDGRRVAGWTFPATATPGNGQVLTINDLSVITSGYSRGVYIDYTQTGVKGGGAWVVPLAIDLTLVGDVGFAFAQSIGIAFSGAAIANYGGGIYIYLNDPADGSVVHYCGLMIGIDAENAPSGTSCFMRVYGHGGAVDTVIWLANGAGTPITYLLDFEGLASPISPGSDSTNVTYKIAMRVGESPQYLHVFSD